MGVDGFNGTTGSARTGSLKRVIGSTVRRSGCRARHDPAANKNRHRAHFLIAAFIRLWDNVSTDGETQMTATVGQTARTVYGMGIVAKANAGSVIVTVNGQNHKLTAKQFGIMN